MKKSILLIIGLFMLTGCNANYNIIISDDYIAEEMSFTETNTALWNSKRENGLVYSEQINSAYSWPTGSFYDKQTPEYEAKKVEGFEYYNIKKINSNGMGLKYDYTFNVNEYKNSSILNLCYEHVKVYSEGGVMVITTSNKFLCFNEYDMLDSVTVNVKTNYSVIDHNADNINGNIYSWNINRNNSGNKLLYIKYKPVNKEENDDNKEEDKVSSFWKDNWYILLIILIVLGIMGIFIFNDINEKNKRNNTL